MNGKWGYYILTILMLVYLIGITCLNIFTYGSVLQWNLSVLSLALVIPLYLGFKMKRFVSRSIGVMALYLVVISAVAYFVMPPYTYEDAFRTFDDSIPTFRKHIGEKRFFYKGDYYVKTESGNFSFDIHTGEIKGVEDDFK